MPHHSRRIRPVSIADRLLTRLGLVVQAALVVLDLAVLVLAGRVRVVLVLAVRVDPVGLMVPAARPLPGLGVRAVRADLVRVVLVLAVRVDPAGLMVPAAPVDLVDPVDLHRMALAALVVLDQVAPGDLMDRTGLVALAAPVVLGRPVDRMVPAGLADRTGLVVLVVLNTADPAALMARAGLVAPAARMVPAGLVDPTGLVVLVDLNTAGLVATADRHRGRMCHRGTMTVPARSGVVRGTPRTASALRVTARHPRRLRTVSGGMADLLPERRRPTGTVHRLPVAGTGRRPLEVGTPAGTDRHHTISVGGRRTTARSTTTATTPHHSSTRCSVAGASGSSVPGSRCTDLTPA